MEQNLKHIMQMPLSDRLALVVEVVLASRKQAESELAKVKNQQDDLNDEIRATYGVLSSMDDRDKPMCETPLVEK